MCFKLFSNFDRAGKSYLLRGDETKEKGIMIQFLEDLLDLSSIARQTGQPSAAIKCTIYGLYKNNVLDLLSARVDEELNVKFTFTGY